MSHFKLKTPIVFEIMTDSADALRVTPRSRGSPELTRTMSRTEAVKQDVRRLKSMTLGRMGKMFKTRTPTVGRSSLGLDTVSDLDSWAVMFYKYKGLLEGVCHSYFSKIS